MYKFFLCVALILLPVTSSAFTYNYYKPLDSTGNNILLSSGPFGSLQNYLCSVSDYSCAKTDLTSFPKGTDITLPTEDEWYNPSKSFVIYRISEKTARDVISRYFFSSSTQNQWSGGLQLPITDDVQKFYWPDSDQDELVYITNADTHGKRDFVRFNLIENKEVARKTVSGAITNGTVSPDGLWLAYYVPLAGGKKSTVLLHLLPQVAESRFEYTVPKNWELLTDANRLLAFSASSSRFAFLEDGGGFPIARIVDLKSPQPLLNGSEIIGNDVIGTAADISFAENDTLLIVGNDKNLPLDWHLYSYDVPLKQLTAVVADVSYLYAMRKTGKQIWLGKMSGPSLMPIVYDPDAKAYHELDLARSTSSPGISREVIPLKNGLYGVLVENKNTKITVKTPLVVWLHGGPYRQIAKAYHSYPSYAVYDWVLDQLALQGAVVFKIDYPGSYGYGNSVTYDVVNNAGKNDIAAVYDSVKAVKKKFNLKGGVYFMGNSYGGYLAPRMLLAYPKEFSGAIAINGVFEWRTLLNYLRTSIFNTYFDGLYDPNKAEVYGQASITNRVKRMLPQQRVVIINGMADMTINPDQSYTFYELLKNAGKNAKLVSIPEEDHVFSKSSSIETICKVSSEAVGFKVRGATCKFK